MLIFKEMRSGLERLRNLRLFDRRSFQHLEQKNRELLLERTRLQGHVSDLKMEVINLSEDLGFLRRYDVAPSDPSVPTISSSSVTCWAEETTYDRERAHERQIVLTAKQSEGFHFEGRKQFESDFWDGKGYVNFQNRKWQVTEITVDPYIAEFRREMWTLRPVRRE